MSSAAINLKFNSVDILVGLVEMSLFYGLKLRLVASKMLVVFFVLASWSVCLAAFNVVFPHPLDNLNQLYLYLYVTMVFLASAGATKTTARYKYKYSWFKLYHYQVIKLLLFMNGCTSVHSTNFEAKTV